MTTDFMCLSWCMNCFTDWDAWLAGQSKEFHQETKEVSRVFADTVH